MQTIHHRDGHLGWDRGIEPIAEIGSGDELAVAIMDCFDGQLGVGAGAADVAALDLDRANPLTGPVRVDGATPGDVVAVTLIDVEVGPTGWTTAIPGFGLLADHFPEPHVVGSAIAGREVRFGDLAVLATRPFLGTVGLAPAAAGPHSVIPPRRVGGNLDLRDVRPGATLLLPVEVDGGLLSLGDPHAAQGDGEVCGTAVETTATARIKVEVRTGVSIAAPQLELLPEPVRGAGRRHVTTGVGPDLFAGARDATLAMIEHLELRHGLDPRDAYLLCSVAAHLRIGEVVDAPNWVVACELDLDVLT